MYKTPSHIYRQCHANTAWNPRICNNWCLTSAPPPWRRERGREGSCGETPGTHAGNTQPPPAAMYSVSYGGGTYQHRGWERRAPWRGWSGRSWSRVARSLCTSWCGRTERTSPPPWKHMMSGVWGREKGQLYTGVTEDNLGARQNNKIRWTSWKGEIEKKILEKHNYSWRVTVRTVGMKEFVLGNCRLESSKFYATNTSRASQG